MQIPDEKWYPAMERRHSRRKFNSIPLDNDILAQLVNFAENLNNHTNGARAAVIEENPERVFKGAVGTYGKIKGAPSYVAFIGNMKDKNVQEKTGYLGECLILEATSMGLATCWVGGFFRPEMVQEHIQLNGEEQVLAVSPLGYADEDYSVEERLMSRLASGHKRKRLETLCPEGLNPDWPDWARSALEAGRIAPSAVNRQPWRFFVKDHSIKISTDRGKDSFHISKRLDCGIAMVHIELGANHEGIRGEWDYLEHPDVALFKVTAER